MIKAIVLIAEGFEEVETVVPVTYMRRAGIDVVLASITENMAVKGARGVQLIADTALADIVNPESFDAVVVPGGLNGAENLAASKETSVLLKNMANAEKLICSICASPAMVLAPLGLLSGKKFTCYPEMEKKVEGGNWSEDRVVIDGNIITSRGAGTAEEFAIAIIEKLLGEAAAKKTADSVLFNARV